MLPVPFSTLAGLVIGRKTFLALLAAITIRPLPLGFAQTAPTAWVAPSLEKIGLNDPPRSVSAAVLWAARGEYESFQIVTHAPEGMGLSNVNIAVSDLQGSGGGVIPASNVTLYREYYVYVPANGTSPNWHGANQPRGPGWYPDALIPIGAGGLNGARLPNGTAAGGTAAMPYNLAAGANQPIWVDVFVPRAAAPDVYSGEFSVASDQGTFIGQISLTVWNFILPLRPALHSSFGVWADSRTAIEVELLRNRITPDEVAVSEQAAFVQNYGLGMTNLPFSSGAKYGDCNMSPMPSLSQVQQAAAAQQPGLLVYNYTADEIDNCKNLVPAIKDWAKILHAAGVKNLITMGPVPSLFDDGSGTGRSAVDIWAVLPDTFNSDSANIQTALQKGDEVWSYNAEVQDAYSPKWEIDFDPVNFRIQPGFLNQSLNLTGLLYWRVDGWSKDPWNDVVFRDGSATFPGEGQLVYPGSAIGIPGVVPSMRLKWLRDGVDDYDYIQLLKQAGYGDAAMKVAAGVGADWTHWTRDPNVIEAARVQLGNMLSDSGKAAGNLEARRSATGSQRARVRGTQERN